MNAFYESHEASAFVLAKKHLESLLAYTQQHFAEEEAMMARAAFPDLASHKELHTRLLASASKLAQDYLKEQSTERGERLANFLKGWLSGHILGVDKSYSPYLLEKGSQHEPETVPHPA